MCNEDAARYNYFAMSRKVLSVSLVDAIPQESKLGSKDPILQRLMAKLAMRLISGLE
jgi:hypothetical protein